MNTPESTSELDGLKKEVAELRQQLAELRQFLRIEPPSQPEGQPILHVRCASLRVCSPLDPKRVNAKLVASHSGAYLLMRRDDQDRIELNSHELDPFLRFHTAAGETAVEIAAEDETDRGYVAVFDDGNPRALMKSTDQAGVVSVVHDDGKVRAGMLGQAEGGEIIVLRPELKSAIKLSGLHKAGGLLSVHGPEDKITAALHATEQGGMFTLRNNAGLIGCSIASLNESSMLRLQTTDQTDQGVSLLCGKNLGASVRVSDGKDHPSAELSVLADASTLSLANAQGQERARVESLGDHAGVTLKSASGEVKSRFMSTGAFTLFDLGGKQDHSIMLGAAPDNAMLVMKNTKEENQFVAGCKDDNVSVFLLPKSGPQAAVGLSTNEHGGCLTIGDREGVLRAGLTAIPAGGQLTLFNDLGIERANLFCVDDGGALKLNWGGTMSVLARGMEQGGAILVNDGNGEPAACLPPRGLKGEGEGGDGDDGED